MESLGDVITITHLFAGVSLQSTTGRTTVLQIRAGGRGAQLSGCPSASHVPRSAALPLLFCASTKGSVCRGPRSWVVQ